MNNRKGRSDLFFKLLNFFGDDYFLFFGKNKASVFLLRPVLKFFVLITMKCDSS